jgi:hypothetical protein
VYLRKCPSISEILFFVRNKVLSIKIAWYNSFPIEYYEMLEEELSFEIAYFVVSSVSASAAIFSSSSSLSSA